MNRVLNIFITASILLVSNFAGAEGISTVQDGVFMVGEASWYSQLDSGVLRTTANMEIFNDVEFTCAIWGVPFNTFIRVTNVANGRSVIVRVNDRGPAKRLMCRGRVIDLTKGAFSKLADTREGLIRVKVEILRTIKKIKNLSKRNTP